MNNKKLPDYFFPYLVAGSFPTLDGTWKFLIPQGSFEIENKNELIKKTLPLCTGNFSIKKILEQFTLQEKMEVEELIIILFDRNALTHVNRVFDSLGDFSGNPGYIGHLEEICKADNDHISESMTPSNFANENKQIFMKETGALGEILERRQSSRDFSGTPLPTNQLLAFCWSMYGKLSSGKRVVPSGGGYYPLTIYVCVLLKCGNFAPGIYEWIPNNNNLQLIRVGDFVEKVKGIYFSNVHYEGAAVSFYIFADTSKSSKKYSNAAFRFAILEAGHAVQNGYLFCAQNNLKMIEIAGNSCSATRRLLGLNTGESFSIISGFMGK